MHQPTTVVLCSYDGCDKTKLFNKGLCYTHWKWQKHGRRQRPTPEERFLAKVDVNGPTMPHMDTNCHVWTASLNPEGYGKFGVKHNGTFKVVGTHRWSYEQSVGPIPENQHVLHRCDNRRCTRPDHLFLGDQTINNLDRESKKTWNRVRYFTEPEVREVRRRHATGESIASLSRDHGVSRAVISNIVNRRTWPDLTP